ncbi:Uncharacterised nucleotidyltransferase [Faunimonas pinastri]|uniref:Uncharacterized nucleotidyltransferase n=1 Tax=Faunimonas pinastri TaxID=1855383 RepID=A0A1H9FUR1_9HYPH|nr:nucleotidyltransferase [Faunimonas pinastri]SEQ41238.1 Uncharacterised nucleotidyltransferase [Faunimonas pinastri]
MQAPGQDRSDKEPIHKPALELSPEASQFYTEVLRVLTESNIRFLVAGTFAVGAYTDISRPTKDIDIFCKPGDYPRILHTFHELGYETAIEDERWLAKVKKGPLFFDVIFNSTASVTPVTDAWFEDGHEADILGFKVPVLSPTELIWSKVFVQNRERYDGADVVHVMLHENDNIDWKRLLSYMEAYWEVLLVHILNFRFIYPTERHRIPSWLMAELMDRLKFQEELPVPETRICRGRMFSKHDYRIDVMEWGFSDAIGEAGVRDDA